MTKELKPHEVRVVNEREELSVKVERLAAFFDTQVFAKLPEVDAALLRLQLKQMNDYRETLDQRIARF